MHLCSFYYPGLIISVHYLGLLFLDPIASQLNGRLGESLTHGHRSITDAVFTTRDDGRTLLFMYHVSTKKMNALTASAYCQDLGMSLPVVDSDLSAVRNGIFSVVNGDIIMDGTDTIREGVFRSFYDDRKLMNQIRWGPRIDGHDKRSDCTKIR